MSYLQVVRLTVVISLCQFVLSVGMVVALWSAIWFDGTNLQGSQWYLLRTCLRSSELGTVGTMAYMVRRPCCFWKRKNISVSYWIWSFNQENERGNWFSCEFCLFSVFSSNLWLRGYMTWLTSLICAVSFILSVSLNSFPLQMTQQGLFFSYWNKFCAKICTDKVMSINFILYMHRQIWSKTKNRK